MSGGEIRKNDSNGDYLREGDRVLRVKGVGAILKLNLEAGGIG